MIKITGNYLLARVNQSVKRIEMMRFVEHEELDPVNDGQKPKTRMERRPIEVRFVRVHDQGEDPGPVGIDLFEQ